MNGRGATVAIDFGTERTKIAFRSPVSVQPDLVRFGKGAGRPFSRSLFHLPPRSGAVAFGELAEEALKSHPEEVIVGLKRQLRDQKVRCGGRSETPESLLVHMFRNVRASLTAVTGLPARTVLTIPANYGPDLHDLMRGAAISSGFPEVETIYEPIAAVRAWQADIGNIAEAVVVVDCGAGTVDWACLSRSGDSFRIVPSLPPGSLNRVGGQDIDLGLLELLEDRLPARSQLDTLVPTRMLLLEHIRQWKEAVLTEHDLVPMWADGQRLPLEWADVLAVVHSRFNAPVVSALSKYLDRLANTDLTTRPAVLLVGGSARLPGLAEEIGALGYRAMSWKRAEFAAVLGGCSDPASCRNENSTLERKFQMSSDNIRSFVGLDLGDAETAFAQLGLLDGATNPTPTEIGSTLAGPSGVIKTVVGYTTDGEILVGKAVQNSGTSLRKGGLKVGFKTVPTSDDGTYKTSVQDFVDIVIERLEDEKKLVLKESKMIVGHPSKWKKIPGAVDALEEILRGTSLARSADLQLVPESRGAMVEAVYSSMLNREALSGWALVVDIGSSTTDFTAVNLATRAAEPVDFGEDIGARLIDRAIVDHFIAVSDDRVRSYFGDHPEERAKFELWCRDLKEIYFSGAKPEIDYGVKVDGHNKVYIEGSLDNALMHRLTSEVPVAQVFGKRVSWRDGFRRSLTSVKADLKKLRATPITAILLTGGASNMGFVREDCVAVFPEVGKIASAGRPQFTVASGLARWGRIQYKTDHFITKVEQFCDTKIPPRATSMVDSLYNSLSNMIAAEILGIIKAEFNAWKNSRYTTINAMNAGIQSKIESWLKTELPSRIERESGPLLKGLAIDLANDIKGLENEFGISVGSLGGVLSRSIVSDHSVKPNVDLRSIDVSGGSIEVFGNVIGVVAGLVTGVVMLNVVPIAIGIVLKIIAVISAGLAWTIAGLLLTNPVGWALLVGIGITAILAGAEAKERIKSMVPDWDLPKVIRGLVGEDSVYAKVDSTRDEIVTEVQNQLNGNKDLRKKIVEEATKFFRERLVAAADDARMLIS